VDTEQFCKNVNLIFLKKSEKLNKFRILKTGIKLVNKKKKNFKRREVYEQAQG